MPEPRFYQRTIVQVAVLTIGILVLHYLGALTPIERLLVTALQPVGRTVTSWFNRQSSTSGLPPEEGQQERRTLEQRIADLSVENVKLRAALDAFRELSIQERFLKEKKFSGVPARIFARATDPTSEYVVVDVGKNDGVEIGAPVIVGEGIIVGQVLSVTPDASRILLTTDNRSSFAGVVADNPSAEGVVSGNRGLSLRMDLIPQTEDIRQHQIIVSSGTDANVPRGLILGEVVRVVKRQGALFQSASLRTLYRTSRLDTLTILTTKVQ